MANEIQYLGMLLVVKNGATVSLPQKQKTLNMSGSAMVQQPQTIPTAGAALNLGLISGAPAKLALANNNYGQGVSAVAIASGGTGYVVGDVLTIAGGSTGNNSSPTACTLTVSTVASGVITAVTITTQGDYSVNPATVAAAVTGGTGTGATFNLTMANNNVTIYGDSGYSQAQDTIQPGDFILRSPASGTLYCKATCAPVYILTVACST